jgi:hypothetical protein
MNAHTPTDADADPQAAFALQILRDRYTPGAFLGSIYTVHEWCNAAQYALDESDYSELEYMEARDEDAEAESRAESRRLGCDEADYRYDMAREVAE